MAFMFPTVMLIVNISSVAVLWFGAHRIDAGQMQVGALTAFLSYLMQILMSIMMATFMFVMIPRAEVCAERIKEVLTTESSVVIAPRPVTTLSRHGFLELRDVDFHYPGAEAPVLCGVHLTARPREVTAVIGDGELAEAIARKAELFKDMHLAVVRGRESLAGEELDAENLDRAITGVDRVVLASPSVDPNLIARLVVLCRARQIKLSVVSPLRGRALPVLRITQVADLPVFDYDTWDVSRSTLMLKRGFDVLVSSAALLVLAPLVPLVALAIRLDSRGPVIFSQLRAGAGGQPFRMHKLRTMTANAEESLSEIVRLDELREPMFKLRDDPRVTRVGRLLRRFSLDELPQLVNVLRGEMSIVGPRPEQVELVERYEPEHRFRLAVKPGMTGPMQVFGRGELTFAERLAVELDYVENMSIGRDLRILFQTVPAIARGTGAF
jgi:exopolysaccharide biosynthesis polyprenyl glycosylphosphotransferase